MDFGGGSPVNRCGIARKFADLAGTGWNMNEAEQAVRSDDLVGEPLVGVLLGERGSSN